MPGTAKLRGLADPFNPAEALEPRPAISPSSAGGFGNIGLAAVAYNGGEARAERFIAEAGRAAGRDPRLCRGDHRPFRRDVARRAAAALDLALATETSFQAACIAQAASRTLREFPPARRCCPGG